jgi:hypothetical protein
MHPGPLPLMPLVLTVHLNLGQRTPQPLSLGAPVAGIPGEAEAQGGDFPGCHRTREESGSQPLGPKVWALPPSILALAGQLRWASTLAWW